MVEFLLSLPTWAGCSIAMVSMTVIGFVVTMACFGAFKPQTPVLALVTLYTLFVGLVRYLILTLSDPFQGIGVQPTSFEYLVKKLQGGMK